MCCRVLLKVHLYIFVPFVSNSNNIGNSSSSVCVRKHRAEVAFILNTVFKPETNKLAPVRLQVGDAAALELRQGGGR